MFATVDHIPAKVQAATVPVAVETAHLNPDTIDGFLIGTCQWSRTLEGDFVCPVTYVMGDDLVKVNYRVGRVLTRKRRNGHWIGPWHKTKEWAVTDVLDVTEP